MTWTEICRLQRRQATCARNPRNSRVGGSTACRMTDHCSADGGLWVMSQYTSPKLASSACWSRETEAPAGVAMQLVGVKLHAAKDSPCPFTQTEMERFDRRG